MPTNKLWIEHTERAAWESVQALRVKLADAEKRLERLAPPVEGWRELLDGLAAAAASAGLPDDAKFADLLRATLARTSAAESRARELDAEVERLRLAASQPSAAPGPSQPAGARFDPALEDDELDAIEAPSRRFARALERRERELGKSLPTSVSALLAAIEAKLDELSEGDDQSLADGALELGLLASRLERAARRAARDRP